MRIITRTPTQTQYSWQQILSNSIRTIEQLYQYLNLDAQNITEDARQAAQEFPILVPEPYLKRIKKGDPEDPLLLQVLASNKEMDIFEGFVKDPLEETISNVTPGIIHKYHGRILLMVATGCAVNCRYCFRRHFDYADNRLSREQQVTALNYVKEDPSITEVILSGGDPLLLSDDALSNLVTAIEQIPHVKRLRIHSRLPVVIPQRITEQLTTLLSDSRLSTSLVLHINHAQEMDEGFARELDQIRASNVTLLNQTVLLKGINTSCSELTQLSEALFSNGILPYYLHTLDKVQGAGHFFLSDQDAIALHKKLQHLLPGYLVPKLVREIPAERSKTLLC